MPVIAHSVVSREVNSLETGAQIGRALREKFGRAPGAVLTYTTISHDSRAFLRGLHQALGSSPIVVGCTSQGVVSRGQLLEEGYAAGALGLAGQGVHASSAMVERIEEDPRAKGRALGLELTRKLSVPPKAIVICYDPLCAADVGALLDGLHEVADCPVVGGGAGQSWGPMVATFQFLGESVHHHSAVALAIGGDLSVVVGACHGTKPLGMSMKVTRCEGTSLLELDGRRASEVWEELTGEGDPTIDHRANLALGLPREEADQDVYRVLAPFGIDREGGSILLQAGLAAGTEVMFHHRTEQSVVEGTERMARQIRGQLGARKLRAVMGFECGARTAPFLGSELAQQENYALQDSLGPDAAWLGMLAWGEVFPLRRGPAVFNYTYPLLCLAD